MDESCCCSYYQNLYNELDGIDYANLTVSVTANTPTITIDISLELISPLKRSEQEIIFSADIVVDSCQLEPPISVTQFWSVTPQFDFKSSKNSRRYSQISDTGDNFVFSLYQVDLGNFILSSNTFYR